MKAKILMSALAASLLVFAPKSFAADESDAGKELQELVAKVQEKLKEGKKSEKDLAPELKEFDTLLAKHKGEKTDEVAQILLMKGLLYLQVLEEDEKGVAMIKQLKKDFPETAPGQKADDILESIEKQAAARAIQKSLAVGKKFPDFAVKDLEGKPLSLADYKGKVVLVDFWATWCGPCVAELPNVLSAYEKYHGKGFDIVGISLDKDEDALKNFIKKKKMTWRQYFDGKGWQNELAGKYGVNSIPATYLLDGQGVIIAKNLRGSALDDELEKSLKK